MQLGGRIVYRPWKRKIVGERGRWGAATGRASGTSVGGGRGESEARPPRVKAAIRDSGSVNKYLI